VAEGVGFEPTVRLPVRLISSQVHSTTLPPFHLHEVERERSERIEQYKQRFAKERPRPTNCKSLQNLKVASHSPEPLNTAEGLKTLFEALIHFFLFGISPFRPKIFVIVRELVHGVTEKTDNLRTHRIEPLGGHEKQGCGADQTAEGHDPDKGIQPTDHRRQAQFTGSGENCSVAPSERAEDAAEENHSAQPDLLGDPIKPFGRDRFAFGKNPPQSPGLAQFRIFPAAQHRAKNRCRDNRGKKRQAAQRFQKRQEKPAYQAEDDQHFDHTLKV
jgi:hypothetical protein